MRLMDSKQSTRVITALSLMALLSACGGLSEDAKAFRSACVDQGVYKSSICNCTAKELDKVLSKDDVRYLADLTRAQSSGDPTAALGTVLGAAFDPESQQRLTRITQASARVDTKCAR